MRRKKDSKKKYRGRHPLLGGYQPIGDPLPTDPEELAKVMTPPQGGTGAVRPSYNSYNGEKERR